jgi:hypothetical protein
MGHPAALDLDLLSMLAAIPETGEAATSATAAARQMAVILSQREVQRGRLATCA